MRRVLGLIRDEAEEDRAGNGDDSMSDISNLPGDETPHQHHHHHHQIQNLTLQSSPASPPPRPPPSLRSLTSTGSFHVPQSMFSLLHDSPKFGGSTIGGSPLGRSSGASTPMSRVQVANISALRSEVIEGIEEIKDEITSVDEQIATYAEVQIHPGSYVLVHKPGATVEKFLLGAAKRRKFTVLITGVEARETAGGAPYEGLKRQLSKFGVSAITILGGGVMAYMSRVNLVVLGAQAVTANGAVLADGGAAMVARAAREFGKTVIVLGGVYKLCPEDEPNLDALVGAGAPGSLVGYDDEMVEVEVETTSSEYINPDMLDIYITNL